MRISHKNKFLWISKPKTGSTSYRMLLDPYSDIESVQSGDFNHHAKLSDLEKVFKVENWDFTEYRKIVASRNPYELLVSLYTYSKTDINGNFFWQQGVGYDSDNLMNFKSWIYSTKHHKWFFNSHRLEVYTHSKSGEKLADFIFSPELESEKFINYIRENCGIDVSNKNIPRSNTTLKSNELLEEVKECFSDLSLQNEIEIIFKYEFEMFNYKNPYV
jgi:hypothetical protein